MQHPRRRKSDNGHTRAVVTVTGILITAALVAFGASKSKTLDDTEARSLRNHTQLEVLTTSVNIRLMNIEDDVREIKEAVVED